ncbi:hypothetical protein ABPG73_004569 [Tetrahymena malaccensis]
MKFCYFAFILLFALCQVKAITQQQNLDIQECIKQIGLVSCKKLDQDCIEEAQKMKGCVQTCQNINNYTGENFKKCLQSYCISTNKIVQNEIDEIVNCIKLNSVVLQFGCALFIFQYQYSINNEISDLGAAGLVSGLEKLKNLSNLTMDLEFNQIGDEGTYNLGSSIAKCTNLANLTLNLKSNEIVNSVSSLGSCLAKCTYLQNLTLQLNKNIVGASGASNLIAGLSNCTNLSYLNLDLQQKQIISFGFYQFLIKK